MSEKKFNKVTQSEFGKLLLRVSETKDKVQGRIEAGVSVAALAREWGVPTGTARVVLTTAGIELRERVGNGKTAKRQTDPLLVKKVDACLRHLALLSADLGVSFDELKPFLDEKTLDECSEKVFDRLVNKPAMK